LRKLQGLSVSAADEVIFVNAVNGANLNARSAACAKRIIDGGKVAFNLNRTVGASLLALHATNASVGALLASDSALIVVRALNNNLNGVVYKLNDVVGAFANAHAAADALLGVYQSHAVLNVNGILGANASAVAVAEAGIGAGLVTVIHKVCGNTALKTCVVVFSFGSIAGAVAGNVCNLLYNVLSLNAKGCGNCLSGLITTGNTKVCFFLGSVCQSLCIAVAAGIAARTAVCTGQALSNGFCGLILFYTKEDVGER
jgi:hypothetical protein